MNEVDVSTRCRLFISVMFLLISIQIIMISSGIIWVIGILILNYALDDFWDSYNDFMYEYILYNKERYKKISTKELEMVENAKKLVKSVDENIILSDFKVYNIRHISDGFYHENAIFIPFGFNLAISKNLCFVVVVHEILHSQNLKNNNRIFCTDFLEGLNQLMTLWLIENYSEQYKIPKVYEGFSGIIIRGIYRKQVKLVRSIIQKSNIDLKQVYLNYIDLNPAFFRNFVSSEYFL